jgi:hypothetical protein
MSLKILLGKFVAFFAGQIPVEGHKNIIDSFQKLIVSPKRFICAHDYFFTSMRTRSIGRLSSAARNGTLCYPRLAGKISLSLRDPSQTNETIHLVVGDEGGPVIVAGDPALVLERTLCKRRSGGRLLQESWSIDFQASPA